MFSVIGPVVDEAAENVVDEADTNQVLEKLLGGTSILTVAPGRPCDCSKTEGNNVCRFVAFAMMSWTEAVSGWKTSYLTVYLVPLPPDEFEFNRRNVSAMSSNCWTVSLSIPSAVIKACFAVA